MEPNGEANDRPKMEQLGPLPRVSRTKTVADSDPNLAEAVLSFLAPRAQIGACRYLRPRPKMAEQDEDFSH